ncbi:MAG: leucine-rich repeat protein, partial [Solobacterium sp.]|nr:leucine-rich repeat protein [Solobacterium sp.]
SQISLQVLHTDWTKPFLCFSFRENIALIKLYSLPDQECLPNRVCRDFPLHVYAENEPSEEVTQEITEAEETEEETDSEPSEEPVEETIEETTGTQAANDAAEDYEYSVEDNEIIIKKYIGTDTEISIPSEIDGLPVTSIYVNEFRGCSTITNLFIPNSISSIGSHAFSGCSSLSKVTVPGSVTELGYDPFEDCSSLRTAGPLGSGSDYEFGWTVSIPANAFSRCTGLTNITLPDSITSIGGGAFSCCSNLTDIIIPENITTINSGTFSGCSKLTEITIPYGVTDIGYSAFESCSSLTDLTIPESVVNIGNYAFRNCGSLTEIVIPDSVVSIGSYVFEICSSLRKITIPDSVATIDYGIVYRCANIKTAGPIGSGSDYEFGWTEQIPDKAFGTCENLTDVALPETITYIGAHAFEACSNLKSISIPDSVTGIGEWAFTYCSGLTSITIPDGITKIGYSVFSNCTNLNTVIIPDSITDIDSYAFTYCPNLVNVQIPETVGSIGKHAFTGCTSLLGVIIPQSVVSIGENAFGYRYNNGGYVVIEGFTIYGYSGTAAETYANENGIAFIDMNVTELNASNVADIKAQTYTGKAIRPAVTVTVNGTALVNGTDYTVSYKNNINAGTASVTVTGTGKYTGAVTKNFTINKASQKVTAKAAADYIFAGKTTTITVTGNQGDLTYTSSDTSVATVSAAGKVTGKKAGTVTISVVSAATQNYKKKTSTVTVTVQPVLAATSKIAAANKAGGIKVAWKAVTGATGYYIYRNGKLAKTVTDGSTTSWGDTKATGNGTKYTYKIVAYCEAGKSSSSKSLTTYWLTKPAISSLTNSAAGKLTVKWGKNTAATGYQVQYSTSSKFTAATTKTVTIRSNTTVSKVIASLTKGKTYYVRVRSYKTTNSVNYYSMWSAVKNLKLTK